MAGNVHLMPGDVHTTSINKWLLWDMSGRNKGGIVKL